MNFDLKELPSKIKPYLSRLHRYRAVIFSVMLIFVYGWLIMRVNSYSSIEPSEDDVSEKLQSIPRPKIDESALLKIQQLQDNSAEVRALFKQARDNPFRE